MRSLVVIILVAMSSCYTEPSSCMDSYCWERCEAVHENLDSAEWQGDDSLLQKTRCGCFVGGFEYNHLFSQGTCHE